MIDKIHPSEIGSLTLHAPLCLVCKHMVKGVNFERSCKLNMKSKEIALCRSYECDGFVFETDTLPYNIEGVRNELIKREIDPETILK